jgi:hypothetical protein
VLMLTAPLPLVEVPASRRATANRIHGRRRVHPVA